MKCKLTQIGLLSVILAASAQAQKETLLHSFDAADGGSPLFGVVLDAKGNLYGEAQDGGPGASVPSFGSVYKINTATNQFFFPHFFQDDPTILQNGIGLYFAPPFVDAAGNLWGEVQLADIGPLYRVSPSGVFSPFGVLPTTTGATDAQGNSYFGTGASGTFGAGTIVKLSPSGAQTILYNFRGGADGADPSGNLVVDKAGNVYGSVYPFETTGALPSQQVYKISPTGVKQTIHTWPPVTYVALYTDSFGNVYGEADLTGTVSQPQSTFQIFSISPTGKFTVLKTFVNSGAGTLLFDSKGNIYSQGAAYTFFKLTPAGVYSVIGTMPNDGFTMDAAGNFYGVTKTGGAAGQGALSKMSPTGAVTLLHSFGVTPGDGLKPETSIAVDQAGNVFGATSSGGAFGAGTVYKVSQ